MKSLVAPKKLSFEQGGAFMSETRREVDLYLASRGTRAWGRAQLYAKTFVAFALLVASWATLIFVRPGLVLGIVTLAGAALGAILVGFCVQHDANHGAYFRTRRFNHLMGWSSDSLLGFSSYAWRVKHNVAHHTYTNVEGYDDDINQAPFIRLTPTTKPRWWYRLQHIYIWPLYSLMVLRWQTGADITALIQGRIANSRLRPPKRWDLTGLIAGKLIFISWAIVVPLLVYPWWVVFAGYVAFAMTTSLVTATTFQLAHCVEEADFTTAEDVEAGGKPWAVHEVESTVDFCPRNPVLTWVLGGLNYQIEHHLFPRVPHTHYPRIAQIVRRNASKYGVRYTAQPSLFRALRSHQRHLRALGRQGVPVEIELG
jgi:linoleoyl-CoA desaturase